MAETILIVFTKPWTCPLPQLADTVAELGLQGVELPVRPGYQVTPETVATGLPAAARTLAERGLEIRSVAGPIDEATIAACGEAGVPIIRICVAVDMAIGFRATVEAYRRQFDALIPALERHGVTIGIQNHSGLQIGSAAGVLHLIEPYDPRHVCAVLDMAHCAVAGEPTALAVDILADRMRGLANFKSAYHRRVNGPEEEAVYKVHWTTHQHAGYSWREYVRCLRQIGFSGAFCLPAEYSHPSGQGQRMGDDVLPFLRSDIAFLKALLAEQGSAGAVA
ncbi:sugar phosphate isomerase/epimerase [Inquilinus limosus]|uniref:sugar phosphate isomerase/epimerase family protein n=1 Tax=Inquilinus limosus TaxID=171674 RepID=UPI003F15AB69